jgi:hypothetical protein
MMPHCSGAAEALLEVMLVAVIKISDPRSRLMDLQFMFALQE